jgi:dethiobiotin synthetase
MRTILVTGTGAEVGKTWTACAVARALRALGRSVIAIKPVETGCTNERADGEDGALLAAATGQSAPRRALIRLAQPLAPAVAAEREGVTIDFDALLLKIEKASANAEVLLLEGAGGLLSPITWEWNAVDLARSLSAAALVVAPDRRGTINATLLTLSALELAGMPVAGVVLRPPERTDATSGTNASAIARLSGLDRVLAVSTERDVTPVAGWVDADSTPGH